MLLLRTLKDKFYWFVFLMLAPAFVSAESGTDQATKTLDELFTSKPDPEADITIHWLERSLGDFVYALWGVSGSEEVGVLATVLGYTNVIALILGVGILIYVLVSGALNTASSGEVLGERWSTLWLPIRTAAAFGLLLPVKGIGGGVLSVAQVFVVWLVMMGSGAATILWGMVVDKVVLTTPSASVSTTASKVSFDMFGSLLCAQSLWQFNTDHDTGKNYLAKVSTFGSSLSDAMGNKKFDKGAVALIDGPLTAKSFDGVDSSSLRKIEFGVDGVCGEINFTGANTVVKKSEDEDGWEAKYYKLSYKAGVDAIINHLGVLSPYVSTITSPTDKGGFGGADGLMVLMEAKSNDEIAGKQQELLDKHMAQVAATGTNLVNSLQEKVRAALSGNKEAAESMTHDMKKLGWPGAGQWFFEISRFQNLSNTFADKLLSSVEPKTDPVVCPFSIFGANSQCEEKKNYVDKQLEVVDYYREQGPKLAVDNLGMKKEVTTITSPDDIGFMLSSTILNSLAYVGKDGWGTDENYSVTSLNANPFMTVSAIGHGLNKLAISVWSIGLVMTTTSGGIDGASESMLSSITGAGTFGKGVSAAMKYIISSLVPILLALLSTGFMLAYLIPFMPITLWIVMLAGYMLTVIEAIAAVPLAVIMMTTPEGEGIIGQRAERAIALIAAVVLRPTLMVVGIVAAYFVAGAAFGFFNFIFWGTAERMFPGFGPIDMIAMIIVYTATAYQLCKYSISIMHRLPDQILEWMSGGLTRSFGEGEIGSVMEGNVGHMKNASSGVVQGAMGAFKGKDVTHIQGADGSSTTISEGGKPGGKGKPG